MQINFILPPPISQKTQNKTVIAGFKFLIKKLKLNTGRHLARD